MQEHNVKASENTWDDQNIDHPFYLKISSQPGLNIIGGATGSGKTTLTNNIIESLYKRTNCDVWSWSREEMRLGCEHLYDCGLGSDGVTGEESIQQVKQWNTNHVLPKKIVALSEVRSCSGLDLARELVNDGNQVFCTTVYSSVSQIIERFVKVLVAVEEREDFINCLDWVIAKKLLCSDGNLMACHEYLRFSREIKKQLLAIKNLEPKLIGREIQKILLDQSDECCSMLISARTLLKQEKISNEIYGWLECVYSRGNE